MGFSEYASYGYTAPAFTDDDATLTYTFTGLPSWLKVCYPTQNPRYLCGRPPYTESTYASSLGRRFSRWSSPM